MAELPAIYGEDLSEYGPAMQRLNPKQRSFVLAYLEHPLWSQSQIAEHAGYTPNKEQPAQLRVRAHLLMHNEGVIAAINEESSKRMRGAAAIAVSAVVKIAMDQTHKDHLKAALALMDRTGHHALSEHKVTVDDKRPQTKAELIAAVRGVAAELGITDPSVVKQLTGEDVVEAEFTEVESVKPQEVSLDADIAKQMEDL